MRKSTNNPDSLKSGRAAARPDEPEAVQEDFSETLSSDAKEYLEELYRRLPQYARRAAVVPPNETGSIEWFTAIGKFLWQAREGKKMSRYELAERAGIHVNEVRFLEFGLVSLDYLRSGVLKRYADALGRPELYSEFKQKFDLP